ncbi:energy-coupling factor transporter transmembrane component T [Brachybacterium hainanense]|uniref:Energy-coupling factor transporter transmembrane component T n=1 Tax=Brachybacterium hainanense TaxID=1541174 RepID=A0ABV6R9H0_9MICO
MSTIDPALLARYDRPLTTGNPVRDLNPITIGLILASIALAGVALPGLLPPAAACVLYVLVAAAAGAGRRFLSLYAKLFAVVGGMLFALRAVFLDSGAQLLVLGPFVISSGGVLQAARFSLVVMALCGAVTLFFHLTPMKNLMLALEARGLSPRITYIVLASFQSIIDLGRSSRTVMDAQRSRGVETEGSLRVRVKAFVPVLAPVFLAAMNQTEERAVALDARAFTSLRTHTHLARLRPVPVLEIVLAAVCALLALAVLVGRILL